MKISKMQLSESRNLTEEARRVYNEQMIANDVPLAERIRKMAIIARLINIAECMLDGEQINITK